MSADNGIYLLHCEDDAGEHWRVVYAGDLGEYTGDPLAYLDEIRAVFSGEEVRCFASLGEAMVNAEREAASYTILEHGIQIVNVGFPLTMNKS